MTARPRDREGFVLVTVLWVLAILTIMTVGFGRRTMLDMRSAAYSLDHTLALHQARGAVHRAAAEVRNKGAIDAYYGQIGYVGRDQRWAVGVDLYDEGIFERPPDFEADGVTWIAEDEESRINVNTASDELLSGAGLGMDVIRRIRATIMPEEEGVEGRQFQRIEELRFIRGIDDEAWFGTPRQPGIKDMFTVFGDGRINLNTASAAVLAAIPGLSPTAAQAIVNYRAGPDGVPNTQDDIAFRSFNEIVEKALVPAAEMEALSLHCKLHSSFFTITGVATRRQGAVVAYAQATVGPAGNVMRWREEPLGW